MGLESHSWFRAAMNVPEPIAYAVELWPEFNIHLHRENDEIAMALANVDEWTFDIFKFNAVAEGIVSITTNINTS